MTAIVIPARNEAAVIGETLVSVLGEAGPGDEVIVVCNGCSDDTAAAARRLGERVTVLETEVPSKTNALNLGDRRARTYPRLYLDADVRLEPGALAAVVKALEAGPWLAVSPEPRMDFGKAGWAVKAYYDIWLSLPYCRSGLIGAGAYALSRAGRSRFGEFPEVITDDGYVRAHFKEGERGLVAGARAIVRAPATLEWLVRVKARTRRGAMEMAERFPELTGALRNHPAAFGHALANPLRWPKVAAYLYVNLASRLLAWKRHRSGAPHSWEQDLSSRSGSR